MGIDHSLRRGAYDVCFFGCSRHENSGCSPPGVIIRGLGERHVHSAPYIKRRHAGAQVVVCDNASEAGSRRVHGMLENSLCLLPDVRE